MKCRKHVRCVVSVIVARMLHLFLSTRLRVRARAKWRSTTPTTNGQQSLVGCVCLHDSQARLHIELGIRTAINIIINGSFSNINHSACKFSATHSVIFRACLQVIMRVFVQITREFVGALAICLSTLKLTESE